MNEALIIDCLRTPAGKAPRGALRNVRPDDLAARVIEALLARYPSVEKDAIDDVILGCAMPEAEQGMNVARIGLLLAGLPKRVPGMTVNRFCSSGLQAVALAADRIRLGEAEVMIGAGTESMSMIPMGGNKISINPAIFSDENIGIAYGMGITAEKVASQWKVRREKQDEFALESHQRAVKAIDTDEFKQEITPYAVTETIPDLVNREVVQKVKQLAIDEGPRRDTTLDALGKLKPAFAVNGSVTAGNSSQMSDGAGAVVLMSSSALQRLNLKPLARFVGYAVVGVRPEIMGIGPKEAIPRVLHQTGVNQNDLDWIELNEAFAAQSLAVIQDLGLDRNKVNPLGGAIALGHPLGATGAIRTATLVHGLRRHGKKYGMVTMCVGTGMGAAAVFQAL